MIGILGDVHGHLGPDDIAELDRCGYDAILCTGDLGTRLGTPAAEVARRLAELRTPCIAIAGNHDIASPLSVLGDALGGIHLRPGTPAACARRHGELRQALEPGVLGGFASHEAGGATVITCRPGAMDGRHVSFAPWVSAEWGLSGVSACRDRLCALVDEAPPGPLVLLAHNGPAGLGSGRSAPWGLPWRDNGDRDLADAARHARATRAGPIAVVAGHMHHRRRDRQWQLERDGVLYVNAAHVPRRWRHRGRAVRAHVRLELDGPVPRAHPVLHVGQGPDAPPATTT